MNRSARLIPLPALALTLALSSCTHQQQQGAAIGTLGGAAIGAVAGDDSRDVLRGAALGAALGTGVAALSEDAQRRREADMAYYGGQPPAGPTTQPPYQPPYQPPPSSATPPPPQPGADAYPMARRTNIPNQVISPYPPYNVMDVTDVRSGQLARDPKTGEIFRVP